MVDGQRVNGSGAPVTGLRIHVSGVVQGVGFRPFVFALAERLDLGGWVCNTSAGVDIEVDGPPDRLASFADALADEAPPLARIDDLVVTPRSPGGYATFEIRASVPIPGAYQPVSPDVATCADCLAELRDPADRRYRYPFTNCTHCGPRFTIIVDLPYDRPNTTMAAFPLCPACAAEYADPHDRRFHAQPVACPQCGPRVWLEIPSGSADVPTPVAHGPGATTGVPPDPACAREDAARSGEDAARGDDAIAVARRLLAGGQIVAVKGLGGFHLACDAGSAAAVADLRRRKLRVDKPLAVMMPDLATVERHCVVDDASRRLLESVERPIVLVPWRAGSTVAREVAPEQRELGVMLPYTPLHHLLLEAAPGMPEALVMTSGNLSEEPIATDNDDARARLAGLADAFLMHDRPIRTRCDDSVVRVFEDRMYPLRRSRGYAPYPVRLPWTTPSLLAAGAELKNTFALVRGDHAFLSHHIGDLENYETLQAFEDGVAHLEKLFCVRPEAIAHDLHPDYLATRYALARGEREGLPLVGVQHHHAHIAACMAEHGLPGDRPIIGVAFDGTGYGDDGAIWGGEVLLADYHAYERLYHLDYVPLPGGDAATRAPWRVALAWLDRAGVDWADDLPPVATASPEQRRVLARQLGAGLNAPPTSSMGRLFDAVAALAGVRQSASYEAQAAIALEAIVDQEERHAYPFPLGEGVLDAVPVVRAVVDDVRAGVAAGRIAARFHHGVAGAVRDACRAVRTARGANVVALSGGVWQNVTLLAEVVTTLRAEGFEVYIHRQVPTNDGGLVLGQAAVARARLSSPRAGTHAPARDESRPWRG
jgi:hydrogenase maturation protein HypF